jgi:hypothetical protein
MEPTTAHRAEYSDFQRCRCRRLLFDRGGADQGRGGDDDASPDGGDEADVHSPDEGDGDFYSFFGDFQRRAAVSSSVSSCCCGPRSSIVRTLDPYGAPIRGVEALMTMTQSVGRNDAISSHEWSDRRCRLPFAKSLSDGGCCRLEPSVTLIGGTDSCPA